MPSSDMSVQCPTVGCTMVVDECLECRSWAGLYLDRAASGSFVLCSGDDEDLLGPPPPDPAPDRPPIGELPIRAIMTREVVCVRPELGVETVARLFTERGISGAPVLGEGDRPVGVVTKTDLVRELCAQPPRPELTIADIMTPVVFSLPETVSIAHAAALMVVEGIHRLPVLSADGRVVGILAAFDVLKWLARRDGYLP